MSVRILEGDALTVLRTLPDQSVQMCVTSPPYFGLRDYGVSGQLGLEKTPQLYVDAMVGVFSEVRRVLRDDGTLWLNIGDSYAAGKAGRTDYGTGDPTCRLGPSRNGLPNNTRPGPVISRAVPDGLKSKDLIGIPWMLAFALRADGWYLRSDIIWHKPNPMPESVTDRPTKSHEYLFLLTKSPTYYYDADAIAEPSESAPQRRLTLTADQPKGASRAAAGVQNPLCQGGTSSTRNRRSVWSVNTSAYSEAHFATFPPKLIEPCILAGSAKGDTVMDPFGGAGTTGLVADRLGRNAILVELNPQYAEMARKRITGDNPLFTDVA